jgi:microcystin-dependent protein
VAFGAGKVMVGLDAGDALFDTLEETGGSKDAVVVSHTHSVTDPGHAHSLTASTGGGIFYGLSAVAVTTNSATSTATTGISIANAGVSGTNANLQPYITVAVWKRTA